MSDTIAPRTSRHLTLPGSISAARYRAPSRLALNQWSLAGDWTIGRTATVLNKAPGRSCTASTRVTSISSWDRHDQRAPVRFRVTIDGQPPGAAHGLDVDEGGNGTVREQRLYQLVATAEADRRSNVRDRLPRCRRRGVLVHVRLTLSYRSIPSSNGFASVHPV